VRSRARVPVTGHPPSVGENLREKDPLEVVPVWRSTLPSRPWDGFRVIPAFEEPSSGLPWERSFPGTALRDLRAILSGARSSAAQRLRAELPLLGFPNNAPPPSYVEESTPGWRVTALDRSIPSLRTGESRPCPRDWESHFPIRVPPASFLTSTAACSSPTVRACCISLPVLGFAAFPPESTRSPRGANRPSKPSLRRQRRSVASLTCFRL